MTRDREVESRLSSQNAATKPTRRNATLYDAVAGKVGVNGFLTREQRESSSYIPQTPEEVLLRSVNAPAHLPADFYTAEKKLKPDQQLPDSDLLKAIHTYASDYYSLATRNGGKHDFKSLDSTALLAMGILVEEASREMLGDTGDMALVEADDMDDPMPESTVTRHQIRGKVEAASTPQYGSEEDVRDDESPRKRTRYES